MASLATIAFAAAAIGAAALLSVPCAAQECRKGTFSDWSGNETAVQSNGTTCSECDPLCRECFGPGASECFECMSVFVASGRTLSGRRVVECLFTCPEGFGLGSTTLECTRGAQSAVIGLSPARIAAVCVCSVVAAGLLLLAICLLREGCICWKAHHQKTVELQGNGAIEMNNVETIAHEFSFVTDPENPLASGSVNEAGTHHTQHLCTAVSSEYSRETWTQVCTGEGQPRATSVALPTSTRSASSRQEDLAAQGYITMRSTTSQSKKQPGTDLAAQGYITMRSTASHSKDPERGLAAQGYITMHSAAGHSKEDPERRLAAQGYITMHSAAGQSKEEPGTGHRGIGCSKRASSWLLSDKVRPEPHHSSLPRRGYSTSKSAGHLPMRVVGARARADTLDPEDHGYVCVNRFASIGELSHSYDQLKGQPTNPTPSHYEVLPEDNFPAFFDHGYERVRSRCYTAGSDAIYWYASLDQLLPTSRPRQSTADSQYLAMHPQVAAHQSYNQPSACTQHLYERTPGFLNRASDTPQYYYNLDMHTQ